MSDQPSTPLLRPLGVGQILDVGIKIYLANWLTLWKIVVFVVLPAQILVNVIEASATPSDLTTASSGSPFDNPNSSVVISHHELVVFLTGIGVAVLISYIAGQLAQAACLRTVADAYLGDGVNWRSSLRYALRRLPALIGLSLVAAILVMVGFLFCVIPGIYLWGAFYVAVPALLIEGCGPFRALGRSRALVTGRWWGTVAVGVVGYLLVAVVSSMLTAVLVGVAFANPARNTATGFVLNTLASTIGSMLTTPAAAAFATVLYIDLRVRKEGFDLLLLARGLGSENAGAPQAPSFLPPLPPTIPSHEPPPFWPPPPGWTPPETAAPQVLPEPTPEPEPTAEPEPEPEPEPPADSDQPPYWPPPPGWRPGSE